MKKKILLMLIIPIIIFGFDSNVNAIYNGGSGAVGIGLSGCPPNSSTYCKWNNRRHLTMQVSLYYFNANGSKAKIGRTVIATNNNYLDLSGDNVYTDLPAAAGNNESINSDYLEKYFLSQGAFELYLNRISPGLTIEQLTNPSVEGCSLGLSSYGYRLILEPIISWVHNNRIIGGTIKELARMNVQLSNSVRWQEFSWAMHTECNDAGITAPSGGTKDTNLIGNEKIGYGYNIIDVTPLLKKLYYCPDGTKSTEMTACVNNLVNNGTAESTAISTCEKQHCIKNTSKCWGRIEPKGNPAVCTNYNQNNIGTFYEEYIQDCSNTANKFGRPETDFVQNFCKFYCIEKAWQSFPGNIANALSKGYMLIWPTSPESVLLQQSNIFPLSFSGIRTCTMVMHGSDKYDITQSKSPSEIYKGYYTEVENIAEKYETNYSFNSRFGSLSYSSKKIDSIRDNTINVGKCGEYYNPKIETANTAIRNAENALNNWLATETCYDPITVTIKEGYFDAIKKVWVPPVTKEDKKSRKCRADEWSEYGTLQSLRSKKSGLESSAAVCRTYITNYTGMVKTYLSIAECNNKSVKGTDLYNFMTDATLRVEPDNRSDKPTLTTKGVSYNCINCNQSNKFETNTSVLYKWNNIKRDYNYNKVKKMVEDIDADGSRRRVLTISASQSYSLSSGSITTDKGNGNYTNTLLNGFIIPSDTVAGKSYDLEIFNWTLGHNNSFMTIVANPNKTPYICKYNVTETVTDDCICPPGTDHEGKDLYCMIADTNTTCVDAQIDYCNDTSITIPDTCDADLYCLNDPTIKLNACVNSGRTFEECENILCNGGSYKCKNTNGVGGYMDITSCVQTKMAQGLSEQQAIDVCDALVCPGTGLRIIYRTISLENPFPGKTISGGIKGFNTNVNGRYPGANWNSKALVKNDILYSRSNSQSSYGSKIYYNEEPLYTFVLNATTINAIRNYNDTHKYDDFLLDCKKNNSLACVSTFVHDPSLSGLIGGTCQFNTSKTNFYKCSDDV